MFIHCNDNFENFDGPLTPLSDASASAKESSMTQTENTDDAPPLFEAENNSPRSIGGFAAAPTVREPNAGPCSACDLCYLHQRKV